jgi:hypothetical protein
MKKTQKLCYGNRALKIIFRPKREQVTGELTNINKIYYCCPAERQKGQEDYGEEASSY